jgi:hypothetical protein
MSNMRGPILNHVTMIEKFSRWAEIDPNLLEPLGAAFATMNRISPAQRDFCERTVKEMETDPYDKWTSLWKRAPDATLLDNTNFDQTVADRYNLLDVFFWSPSRLKQ